MRRTSLSGSPCPVARALDAIGDWWSLLIIRDAFDGVRRFNDFQKSLGVSRGILTTRLQALVALRILRCAPASDGSAYLEYILTQKGLDLFPVVVTLRQWGEGHCFGRGEQHSVLVENETGRPVGRVEVRSEDGQLLAASGTSVKKLRIAPLAIKRSKGPARLRVD
ncbi:winged helix-turn-helix transcriptional regulator [Bradyrhizobium icense]|uniref:winged helix-turn-helix transcriptional regulator n=1 Tax=Bradyrhizobium icense TaxID=1274631 RepID=UPI0009F1C601|nr:helix-turn-helix domain-containing protein [Bradyrhizobium icense]